MAFYEDEHQHDQAEWGRETHDAGLDISEGGEDAQVSLNDSGGDVGLGDRRSEHEPNEGESKEKG